MTRIAIDASAIRHLASGTGRRLVSLYGADVEGFAALGDWLVIAAPAGVTDIAAALPFAEVRPYEAPPTPAGRALYGHRRLRRVLREVDLVLQDTRPYADPARTLPCVHDLRQLDRAGQAAPWMRAWMRTRFPVALRACPRITVVSEHVRRGVAELSGRALAEIDVVPNGVDVERFRDASLGPLASLGLEPASYLLHVGHRETRKNPAFLGALLERDRDEGGDLRLVSVGAAHRGRDPFAAERDRRNLVDRWTLLEPVPDSTLAALYRGARAFLYPSLIEGFGIPLLEAMAAGTPVLAADRPPFDEIVAEEDRLPPDDAGAWRNRLLALAANSRSRAEASKRGQVRAAEFSWLAAARLQQASLRGALAR